MFSESTNVLFGVKMNKDRSQEVRRETALMGG